MMPKEKDLWFEKAKEDCGYDKKAVIAWLKIIKENGPWLARLHEDDIMMLRTNEYVWNKHLSLNMLSWQILKIIRDIQHWTDITAHTEKRYYRVQEILNRPIKEKNNVS